MKTLEVKYKEQRHKKYDIIVLLILLVGVLVLFLTKGLMGSFIGVFICFFRDDDYRGEYFLRFFAINLLKNFPITILFLVLSENNGKFHEENINLWVIVNFIDAFIVSYLYQFFKVQSYEMNLMGNKGVLSKEDIENNLNKIKENLKEYDKNLFRKKINLEEKNKVIINNKISLEKGTSEVTGIFLSDQRKLSLDFLRSDSRFVLYKNLKVEILFIEIKKHLAKLLDNNDEKLQKIYDEKFHGDVLYYDNKDRLKIKIKKQHGKISLFNIYYQNSKVNFSYEKDVRDGGKILYYLMNGIKMEEKKISYGEIIYNWKNKKRNMNIPMDILQFYSLLGTKGMEMVSQEWEKDYHY